MRRLPLLLLPAAVVALVATDLAAQTLVTGVSAVASTPHVITIPWGAWLVDLITQLQPVFVTLAMGAVSALLSYIATQAPWARSFLADYLNQARISRAVHYGVTQVNGAVVGKSLEIDVADQVLAHALDYLTKLAPDVEKRLGERLPPMILAEISRLGMAPEAAMPGTAALPAKPIPQTQK